MENKEIYPVLGEKAHRSMERKIDLDQKIKFSNPALDICM